MGDAMKRTRVTKRREYVLSSPTNAAEIGKAIHWALNDLASVKGASAAEWDDALVVEARDDEIVVRWDEEIPE